MSLKLTQLGKTNTRTWVVNTTIKYYPINFKTRSEISSIFGREATVPREFRLYFGSLRLC